MHHTTLGRTGLKVSAAGIGSGGFSRLGLKTGLTEEQAAGLIHEAYDLGVNFIDTAPSYGTEGVDAKALKTLPRDKVVVASTHGRLRAAAILSLRMVSPTAPGIIASPIT
jgi:L-galactose dehydrogenase